MNEDLMRQFVENEAVFRAVKDYFHTRQVQFLTELDTGKYSNENLGQMVRGKDEGVKFVDECFKEMLKYKGAKPAVGVPMPGR